MFNEEEFYRQKIFFKRSLKNIKNEYPEHVEDINKWYRNSRYSVIQKTKTYLRNKLKTENSSRNSIPDNEKLYKLYLWYENQPKICFYCGLKEEDLKRLSEQKGHINKRGKWRGERHEIDRKSANKPYDEISNLVIACYWCNNAKTDTFSANEFKLVGKAIGEIWQKRLNSEKGISK